jgi:acyl-coenzyme A synthetase/AMP-(fatty) acid ligase
MWAGVMRPAGSPLLHGRPETDPFLIDGRGAVSVGAFLRHVATAATRLAGATHVVNLCESRLGFLAGYAGAVIAGCTTLLPASRANEVVLALQSAHPGCRVLTDEDLDPDRAGEGAAAPGLAPGGDIDGGQPVMVGFTSGSTGRPTAHRKYWSTVGDSTRLNAARIRAAIPAPLRDRMPWIVGTVPSQHMYGMELTVLLPLLAGMGLHAARPLLPAEVAEALAAVPAPRVLVSTPAHLRAITTSGVRLPRTEVVVSATAPLDAELARAVEAATGGRLVETFGSTETCIIGHRETARDTRWVAYPGVTFTPGESGTQVDAPWFREPQHLLDIIDPAPDGSFELRGRNADLIDVAGKRASLADLTQRILRIPGVVDAIAFQPESSRGLVRRVAALVVAPGLVAADIRAALESAIDPVFMPRPLLLVTSLPRNAAGKLPRLDLEAALATASGRDAPSG